jgi:hypothetical protein
MNSYKIIALHITRKERRSIRNKGQRIPATIWRNSSLFKGSITFALLDDSNFVSWGEDGIKIWKFDPDNETIISEPDTYSVSLANTFKLWQSFPAYAKGFRRKIIVLNESYFACFDKHSVYLYRKSDAGAWCLQGAFPITQDERIHDAHLFSDGTLSIWLYNQETRQASECRYSQENLECPLSINHLQDFTGDKIIFLDDRNIILNAKTVLIHHRLNTRTQEWEEIVIFKGRPLLPALEALYRAPMGHFHALKIDDKTVVAFRDDRTGIMLSYDESQDQFVKTDFGRQSHYHTKIPSTGLIFFDDFIITGYSDTGFLWKIDRTQKTCVFLSKLPIRGHTYGMLKDSKDRIFVLSNHELSILDSELFHSRELCESLEARRI